MKIVAISDTHTRKIEGLPNGDLLVHSGDFSIQGTQRESENFVEWMSEVKDLYREVIIVPGNHDIWVNKERKSALDLFRSNGLKLLIDEGMEFDGMFIYGTPWVTPFGRWEFMCEDKKRQQYMDAIPRNTDILITHGPAKGQLDKIGIHGFNPGSNAGCEFLLNAINRCEPKVHIFGHIHEGSGVKLHNNTLVVNASSMTEYGKTHNGFKVINI